MRVCLDPGHGGRDRGVIGSTGISEAEITLAVCLKLRERLAGLGHEALLTREDDRALSEDAGEDRRQRIRRVKVSAAFQALVSLHCDEASDADISGVTTSYSRGDAFSALLAARVHEGLGSVPGGKLHQRGIIPVPQLAQVRGVGIPAVVVQLGYLSNAHDEALLADETVTDQIAQEIAKALHAWHTERAASLQEENAAEVEIASREEPAAPTEEDAPDAGADDEAGATEHAPPPVIRVTPVMQTTIEGSPAAESRATKPLASASTVAGSSAASPLAVPSCAIQPSPGPGGRSAAAQGIKVTTRVMK